MSRRVEGAVRVTGRTTFTEDLPVAGITHARLVTSYVANGSIRSVDSAAAGRMPGVLAVLTGADLDAGPDGPDAPLARERVFYVGQPVAAVVAETGAAAADAVAAVEVDYETLPAVVDPGLASQPDALLVLPATAGGEDDAAVHGAAGGGSESAAHGGNVVSASELRRGDVDAALADAAAVARGTFRIPSVHHSFLETHVAAASAEPDGSITVWSSTQAVSWVRDAVAQALGADPSRVRVVPMPVGGGFGGKIVQIEPLVALLARSVGRPVRLQFTRSEEFLVGRPAPGCELQVELAANADGDLVALRGEVVFDNGAAGGWHTGVACELMASTYRIPNLLLVGREVATHKIPATSYRAPGAPQAYFALESCLDDLARLLGMDPVQLRLRNASREGDPRGDGSPMPRIGFAECLEAAARHPVYTEPRTDGEGVGVASGGWIGGYGPASAICRLERDGKVTLHLGSVDISGTDTGFAIAAAEVFDVSPDAVRVLKSDSDTAPESPVSGGSAITYSVAPAVVEAAREARRQVLEIAGPHLEVSPEDLELQDGHVQVKGAPFRRVSLAEVAAMAYGGAGAGPIHAVGRASQKIAAPMFGVHVARVRVDPETGHVAVTRYAAVHDIGHAFNRAEVEAQIHGGVVQGLGRALGEEMVWDAAGQPRTGSFLDYAVPTADLVPHVDVELVEVPSEHGARGARGIGEPPAVPGLAAVANAIRDATGTRPTTAPFHFEGLVRTAR